MGGVGEVTHLLQPRHRDRVRRYLNDPYDLWEVYRGSADSKQSSNRPAATAELPEGYAITGGGARILSTGVGVMLTTCCPQPVGGDFRKWTAAGKDHLQGDGSGTASAWVFGIRPRNGLAPSPSRVLPGNDQGALPTARKQSDVTEDVIVGGGLP